MELLYKDKTIHITNMTVTLLKEIATVSRTDLHLSKDERKKMSNMN